MRGKRVTGIVLLVVLMSVMLTACAPDNTSNYESGEQTKIAQGVNNKETVDAIVVSENETVKKKSVTRFSTDNVYNQNGVKLLSCALEKTVDAYKKKEEWVLEFENTSSQTVELCLRVDYYNGMALEGAGNNEKVVNTGESCTFRIDQESVLGINDRYFKSLCMGAPDTIGFYIAQSNMDGKHLAESKIVKFVSEDKSCNVVAGTEIYNKNGLRMVMYDSYTYELNNSSYKLGDIAAYPVVIENTSEQFYRVQVWAVVDEDPHDEGILTNSMAGTREMCRIDMQKYVMTQWDTMWPNNVQGKIFRFDILDVNYNVIDTFEIPLLY